MELLREIRAYYDLDTSEDERNNSVRIFNDVIQSVRLARALT